MFVFRITYGEAIEVLRKHYDGVVPNVSMQASNTYTWGKGEREKKEKRIDKQKEKKKKREKKKRKKKWVPGSHTRDGVRTHVCIRTLELKSNALTTRPPWCNESCCCNIQLYSFSFRVSLVKI